MTHTQHYIGLMSGTSMDGIDAVLVSFTDESMHLIQYHSAPLPQPIKKQLLEIIHDGHTQLQTLGEIDNQLADLFALATQELISKTNISVNQITAIGSHGQTVWHHPIGHLAFSWQLGNGARIAEHCNITTVTDFRQRDIAAGGQGAPLVPAFHAAFLSNDQQNRCIINIGGMGNITYLPHTRSSDTPVLGFDTGPGNALIDWVCNAYFDCDYDKNGLFAKSGSVISTLLTDLLRHTFFTLPIPKSTGREAFNPAWLIIHIDALPDYIKQNSTFRYDLLATITELTAQTIVQAIHAHCQATQAVYICGGGVHNTHLLDRLQALLKTIPVASTEVLGVSPDWMEAIAFAWLAKQTMNGLSGNIPSVTGAKGERILGAIYPA